MSLVIEDSSAQAHSPFQKRKGEDTRRRKKGMYKSEGLRKKRNKARHHAPKDPWIASRKKMVKVRNVRKWQRRAKVEEAFNNLPINETAAAAPPDPVSDAAPSTPLTAPSTPAPTTPLMNATAVENMAHLNLNRVDSSDSNKSSPAFASEGSPQSTSEAGSLGEAEVPKLPPVTESTEEDIEEYIGEAGVEDFSSSYTNGKSSGVARNHTSSKNNKKMRRAKRGTHDVIYKWAVSHSQRNKGWKNRRRAARKVKAELHHDFHGSAPSYSAQAAPSSKKGKWVAVQATKGDCATIKPRDDISGSEVVAGRVEPTPKPVNQSNGFAVLARKRNRDPRWRRKRAQKRSQAKGGGPMKAIAEAAPPVAKDPETTEEQPAPQKRRYRRRYRKKKQAPTNQDESDNKQASDTSPTKSPGAEPAGAAKEGHPGLAGRAGRRKRQRWKKRQARARQAKKEAASQEQTKEEAPHQPENKAQQKQAGTEDTDGRAPSFVACGGATEAKPEVPPVPKGRNRRRNRRPKQQRNAAKASQQPQTTPKKASSVPVKQAETPLKGEEKTFHKRRKQQRRRRHVWVRKSKAKATPEYIPGPTAVDL